MRGDFDEDELGPGDWDEFYGEPDDDEICADCQRLGSMMDECVICGASMCAGCYEMGCGVCRGTHGKG